MIPSTPQAALILFIPAFLGLGLWPSTFRPNGTGTRFEFYSIDFALGALLFGLLAAYTLGAFGSELSFSDRMLVAGYTKQTWQIAGGAFFSVGNMLLLASASMIGLASAFLLSTAIALIVGALISFQHFNAAISSGAILLLLVTVYLAQKARLSLAPRAVRETERDLRFQAKSPRRFVVRGVLIALLSGIPIGVIYSIVSPAMESDFGVGPYAGLLLFSVGMLIASFILNIFFLNIRMVGETTSYRRYWRSRKARHLRSMLGGVLWAAGALALFVLIYLVPEIGVNRPLTFAAPVASVLLVVFIGLIFRKEFASAPGKGRALLALGVLTFVCGAGLLAIRLAG